ncbi:hypothetical protein GCM10025771_01270 [Niveibacterium umoris]
MLPGPWGLGAFGTLGLAHGSSPDVHVRRDLSQPGTGTNDATSAAVDSRVGVQVNYAPADNVEFVAQALSRYRYDASWRPELTWAFGRYRTDAGVDLRLGRLGFDVFLLADSANVGYSYLAVRPQPNYYGGVTLNYFDGADASFNRPLADGVVRLKVYGGVARGKLPTDNDGNALELEGSPLAGLALSYLDETWQLRLGYTHVHSKHELPYPGLFEALRGLNMPEGDQLAARLALEGARLDYWSLAATYSAGRVSVSGAVSYLDSSAESLHSYYASFVEAGYRFGRITPYAGASLSRSTSLDITTGLPPDPALAPIDAAARALLTSGLTNCRSMMLGARWDFAAGMDLKLQIERIRGDYALVPWFEPGKSGQPFTMTVGSVALDFVF